MENSYPFITSPLLTPFLELQEQKRQKFDFNFLSVIITVSSQTWTPEEPNPTPWCHRQHCYIKAPESFVHRLFWLWNCSVTAVVSQEVGPQDFKGIFLACLIKKTDLLKSSFILDMIGRRPYSKTQQVRKGKALIFIECLQHARNYAVTITLI